MTLETKAEANYRPVDTPSRSCHNCAHRIDRGPALSECSLVAGTVDPQHVCDLWDAGEPQEGRAMPDTDEFLDLPEEDRKTLKAADLAKIDDSDFAYIDSQGGRHLPIHDAAHVRAALARFNQTQFDTPADKKSAANKVLAAAKKFGIDVADDTPVAQAARAEDGEGEDRAVCPTCNGKKTIMDGHRKCPDCNGSGVQQNSDERNDPTAVDGDVTDLIQQAKTILDKARAKQKQDPDGNDDPDDRDVSSALDKAAGSLDKATVAQAADNAPQRHRKPRHRSAAATDEYRRTVGREFRLHSLQSIGGLEVREAGIGSSLVEVTGAPIMYNAPYMVRDMLGEFEETMKPGVATRALASGADCRFLFNHEGLPLARTASGTLKLADAKDALRFSAVLDTNQSLANDLVIAIQRGDVTQMSCGFVVADDEWSDDWSKRSINSFAELLDVSAVTYPASPTTSIEIANRMMLEVPVESRARVAKLLHFTSTEVRAGALTEEIAEHLNAASEALRSVLDGTELAEEQRAEAPDTAAPAGSRSRLKLERDRLLLSRRVA